MAVQVQNPRVAREAEEDEDECSSCPNDSTAKSYTLAIQEQPAGAMIRRQRIRSITITCIAIGYLALAQKCVLEEKRKQYGIRVKLVRRMAMRTSMRRSR